MGVYKYTHKGGLGFLRVIADDIKQANLLKSELVVADAEWVFRGKEQDETSKR